MRKYFKDEKEEEFCFSEYLKKDSLEFKGSIFNEDSRIKRTKFLIEILGDVTLEKSIYELFIKMFQTFGGRYDVLVKIDTFRGIYKIIKMYPELTAYAIEEIWLRYIKDLFEEYNLDEVLGKFIKVFGKKEETLEIYFEYVEKRALIHEKKYEKYSLDANELLDDYGEKFVSHIKSLIKRQHYTFDEIRKYLPSSELIHADEQHLMELSEKTRIFFGCCEPVSYTMLDILLEKKSLDTFTETPTYYISTGREELATFTKSKFLESIKKEQYKKLEKK